MGFIKQSIIFCCLIVIFTYIKSFLEPKLPIVFDGYYHPAFKNVADKFKENLESGKERGGAFAVYHKGKIVVDIWPRGGYTDLEAQRPCQKDTMTHGFSNTKGIAAIMVARMVEQGLLNYKDPVAKYWPEFAQNDKGNITVEMLLSHQAGLVSLDEPIGLFDITANPEKVERSLSVQKTAWPAGSAHGYHTLTYGPYVDTLIRKVDPRKRSTDKCFIEEIGKPFEIDMFMTTPREEYNRVARLYEDPLWKAVLKSCTHSRYGSIFYRFATDPNSLVATGAKAVKEFAQGSTLLLNNPYYTENVLSCCFGTGTARGFAKVYGIFSNGGVAENNQRLLSEKAINILATPLVSGEDQTLGVETKFGPGTGFKENPRGELMFGHSGNGGQLAMADLKNSIGVAYLTNYLSMYGFGDDPRYVDPENELYKSLDSYKARAS